MPTELPERTPEKPNPLYVVAVAVGAYIVGALGFIAFSGALAFSTMISLRIMHTYEPSVPPLGFGFLHGALFGVTMLAVGAGGLVKYVMLDSGDDE